jgi:hypothetical protein
MPAIGTINMLLLPPMMMLIMAMIGLVVATMRATTAAAMMMVMIVEYLDTHLCTHRIHCPHVEQGRRAAHPR